MSSTSTRKRAAVVGAAGALALSGVAAVGAISPAEASTSTPTKYACQLPAGAGGGSIPASVVGSVRLPAKVKAGRSLAGIPVTMKVTIPDAVIHQIAGALSFTQLGGKVTKGALQVGTTNRIPLGTLRIPTTTVPPAGSDMSLAAKGKTARTAHAPRKPGKYTVKMPKSFTFDPVSNAQIQTGPLPCTLQGAAGKFAPLRVTR